GFPLPSNRALRIGSLRIQPQGEPRLHRGIEGRGASTGPHVSESYRPTLQSSREVSPKLGGTVSSHPHHLRRYLHFGYDGRLGTSSDVARLKPKEIICLKCQTKVG
ncbi:hypothetical protein BHE74_00019812, partial [Ensete ventricosum]